MLCDCRRGRSVQGHELQPYGAFKCSVAVGEAVGSGFYLLLVPVTVLNRRALVLVHPEVKNWIKYARFEDKHGYIAHGRRVFERAVEFFGEEHVDETLFVAFARFEEMQKEVGQSPNQ